MNQRKLIRIKKFKSLRKKLIQFEYQICWVEYDYRLKYYIVNI